MSSIYKKVRRGELQGKKQAMHWQYPYIKQMNRTHRFMQEVVLNEAISIARQNNSLRNIFLTFFSTHLQEKSKEFNELFAFWLTVFIFREKTNPYSQKSTEDSELYLSSVITKEQRYVINKDELNRLKQLIASIIQKWKKLNHQLEAMTYCQKKLKIHQYFKSYIQRISNSPQEFKFLVPPQLMNNLEEVRSYLKTNLSVLLKVEWLKMRHRRLRLQNFLTITQDYFKTFEVEQIDKNCSFTYGSDNQALEDGPQKITLQDLIMTRVKGEGYYFESKMLIEELLLLLESYHKIVMNTAGQHLHYKYLHPRFIIFNQLSLQMKLAQYPLFIEALGMAQEPLSIEARLVFQATPKVPASRCITPPQVEQKILYNDSYFGEVWWYKGRQEGDEDLQKDRKMRAKMEEENIFWRFLHIAHFITTGSYYNSHIKLKDEYERSIITTKHELQSEPSTITKFIPLQSLNTSTSFQFTLEGLSSLLEVQTDDSVVCDMADANLKHQFSFYLRIKNLLARLLKQNTFLFKSSNVKGYILCLELEILCTLYFIRIAYSVQGSRLGGSRKVLQLEDVKICISNVKACLLSFESKLGEYHRRAENDISRKYLQSPEGKALVQRNSEAINQFKKIMEDHEMLEGDVAIKGPRNCKQKIESLGNQVQGMYQRFVTLFKEDFKKLLVKPTNQKEQAQKKKGEAARFKNQHAFQRCRILIRSLLIWDSRRWKTLQLVLNSRHILNDLDSSTENQVTEAKSVMYAISDILEEQQKKNQNPFSSR